MDLYPRNCPLNWGGCMGEMRRESGWQVSFSHGLWRAAAEPLVGGDYVLTGNGFYRLDGSHRIAGIGVIAEDKSIESLFTHGHARGLM